VSSLAPPLAGLALALAGPGLVGASLAHWAAAAGARLVRVAGRPGSPGAAALARALDARAVALDELASADCDLLLLALPDAELAGVARLLAGRGQAPVALHVAGALGASVLAPLRAAGSAVGSLHPLRAFAAVDPALAAARGVFFAIDGDPPALAAGRRLAAAFGGVAGEVPEATRPLYHFAATLVAGGATTLLAAALELAARAGVPASARAGYGALARGALAAALAADDAADAITGPAARGDLATWDRHLDALAELAPELVPLAVALGRETLRQRARRAPHGPAQQALAARLARAEVLDHPRDRVLTSRRKPQG